jgi:DNA replication protein DnaC
MPSGADFAPPRFHHKTLDGFEPRSGSARRALEAARRFVSHEINGIVFAGPTGVGKSHLAVAAPAEQYAADLAAWEAGPLIDYELRYESDGTEVRVPLSSGKRPHRAGTEPYAPDWCSVPELIVGLRADMDRPPDEKSWAERVDELTKWRGTVVLDDLGREKVSDWTGETLYVLVNGRYEYLLPTIVTTNLTAAELSASPYWPVISRLAEDGELVAIEAADHRLARGQSRTRAAFQPLVPVEVAS